VFPFSRDNQSRTTGGTNNPAQELLNLQSRVYVTMPAFTINIIGEVMDLTATEKAVEYTNVFLSNQNLP
jgi:rRNA processing protein Krr1/Pno1